MSTTDWTVLEKLLLSQAVYKYGEDNWSQIARNLKHHALLDRPSDYFNQKNCSLQYYLMVEDMNKEKRQQTLVTQEMPEVVRLARQLYSQRLEEIQKAISEDEENFLSLVSEIEDIRAGKLDTQLLLGGEHPKQAEPVEEHKIEDILEETEKLDEETESIENTPQSEKSIEQSTQDDQNQNAGDNKYEETPEESNDQKTQQIEEIKAKTKPEPERESEPETKLETKLETETETEKEPESEEKEKESTSDETEEIKEENDVMKEMPMPLPTEAQEEELVSEDGDNEVFVREKTPPEDDNTDYVMKASHKRLAEEEESTLAEPQSKRIRLEERVPDEVEMGTEIEVENEPLTMDTAKTDYSTDADVSQVTTPADAKDGDESNAPTPTNERSMSNKRSSKEDPRQKSWLKNINLLWREIANHKNGAMFMNPIKESIAPQYYDIVKSPMDLKTIKIRIRDGFINTTTEFERDVILMLTNSLMYNTEGTEVYQMAKEMLDDSAEKIRIFKTADEDTSASTHTRASSMAAKDRRKSLANE